MYEWRSASQNVSMNRFSRGLAFMLLGVSLAESALRPWQEALAVVGILSGVWLVATIRRKKK